LKTGRHDMTFFILFQGWANPGHSFRLLRFEQTWGLPGYAGRYYRKADDHFAIYRKVESR